MRKNVLKVMLGSIIVEAILVCLFILIGNFDYVSWRALGSVGIILLYSVPCLCYAKIYDNEKYKSIAIGSVILAGVLALIIILLIWQLLGENDFLLKIVYIANDILWGLAIISWILSIPSINNLLSIFKKISISLTILLSLFIAFMILVENFPTEFLLRLYWVVIVLTVGSWICISILTRIYRKDLVVQEAESK